MHGCDQSPHRVDHYGRGDDVAVQHQITSHFQRFQPGIPRHWQPFDEGTIALGLLEDAVTHDLDGLGQIPLAE